MPFVQYCMIAIFFVQIIHKYLTVSKQSISYEKHIVWWKVGSVEKLQFQFYSKQKDCKPMVTEEDYRLNLVRKA